MTMTITLMGPAGKREKARTIVESTVKPYISNGHEVVDEEAEALDVRVAGAELIASYRLEAMLREALSLLRP